MRAVFFAPESPRPAALMRIALGLVFLYDAAVRHSFAVELYSADGLPMPAFPGTPFEPAALGAAGTIALHALLLFALTSIVVGWQTRLSLWAALLLSLWLGLLDQAGTFKKYSVIGLHLLLLLSFTRCGSVWSLDALVKGASARAKACVLSPVWPRRLMQVLVAALYLGGAVTKLRLPDFANGDLLIFSLLDDQWGGGSFGLWLSTRPVLLILASMGTIFYEIAFPLLIWNARLRRPLLCAAIAFHLLLAATMHLGIFSAVMLVALLAFVQEHDLPRFLTSDRSVTSSLHAANRRRPLQSTAAWLLAAGLWTGLGVTIHDRADGRQSADFFPAIGEETATDMLASLTPAQAGRYGDYFHRIELGNRLSTDGTHAFGGDVRFLRGMNVHACARLIRDHPPLDVEWVLIRPDGEEFRTGYQLAARVTHATFGLALNDPRQTPAGEYRLVLRVNGHEVAERGFVLAER